MLHILKKHLASADLADYALSMNFDTSSTPIRVMKARPEDRLRSAATRLIAHGGLHTVEIRRLAKEARTSTSQFHNFFGCRDNILADVFNEGWLFLEGHAARRLITPRANLADVVEAIAEGLLDAFEEDIERASATLILGFTTIDQPIRDRLRETPGFRRYEQLAGGVKAQLEAQLTPEEADVALQFLFGAIARQLLMLTPLYDQRNLQKGYQFDRGAFLRMLRGMVEGMLGNG